MKTAAERAQALADYWGLTGGLRDAIKVEILEHEDQARADERAKVFDEMRLKEKAYSDLVDEWSWR